MVADLPVQHAALCKRQVQALARPGDGYVHQATLFFQAVGVQQAVLVREQALLQAGNEDNVELQPLGGVHGHQLHRVLAGLCLVVAGLQRGMRQEGDQRGHLRRRFIGDQLGDGIAVRLAALDAQHRVVAHRQRGGDGIDAVALLGHEGLGGGHQFLQVLDAVETFLLALVMRDEAAGVDHVLDDLGQRHLARVGAHLLDQPHERRQLRPRRASQVRHRRRQRHAIQLGRIL